VTNDELNLRYLQERFAYYTECQLATLERCKTLKSTPKSETHRHEKIANGMIDTCRAGGVEPYRDTPRLAARLQNNGSERAL
jgi:hypothetical protein